MKGRTVALLALWAGLGSAQEKPQAFVGGRVIPVVGAEIPRGVVVVGKGKILAVGPDGSVTIPAGAVRHDVSGKVVMPGIVDTHSHVGAPEGADSSAPIQPETRVLDSINVRDARFKKAQAGGITTVNVMPGSGHLLSGQTVYLKLRNGKTIDDLLIVDPKTGFFGGMKMANGTNSRRKPPFPGTRAKSASLVREEFVKAQEYQQKLKDGAADPKKMPSRDLGLEAMTEVLAGKRVVHHHTHRHDDIMTVLRLSKEFGFRVVLHHVTEGYKVADEIAAAGVPCSIIYVDSPGGKLETMDIVLANGAMLEKAGVLVGFHTDDPITDSRLLLRAAGLAVRGGMSRDKALYGLTLAGANILDMKDRVGSLEPGKDADLVVLSGDPLSYRTHVLETWVEGVKVFDRSDPKDRLYAPRPAPLRRGRRRRRGGIPMTGRMVALAVLSAFAVTPAVAWGQVAVRGETVYTMAGPPIKDGVVLIKDGKIEAVGGAGTVSIPTGYKTLTAKVVTPGLIDAHSVVGFSGYMNQPHDQDQVESSNPIQPELRAIDAYNPRERLVAWLRGFGITTIHTGHAPGALVSGQTLIAKTRGNDVDAAVVVPEAMVAATLGNAARVSEEGKSPGTRAKMVAMLRGELVKAQEYLKKRETADKEKQPERSLRLEALGRVLKGEIPLMVTAHRSQDILSALRLQSEFKIRLVLDGAAEAYLTLEAIKKAGVPVIVHPTMSRAFGDQENQSMETPSLLRKAGIPFALQSGFEGYVPKTRVVLFEAAVAAANGLTFEEALGSVTLDGARLLGIDKRVGSLEAGKDGDVALFDGDPFEYTSHCTGTLIQGEVVSDGRS